MTLIIGEIQGNTMFENLDQRTLLLMKRYGIEFPYRIK